MRISDWSSDVCSSDLQVVARHRVEVRCAAIDQADAVVDGRYQVAHQDRRNVVVEPAPEAGLPRSGPEHRPQGGGEQAEDGCVVGDQRAAGGVRHGHGSGRQGNTPRFRGRSEEHTSELQSLMRISYAVFCLKKKKSLNSNLSYIFYITHFLFLIYYFLSNYFLLPYFF